MPDLNDMELIREYADRGSESAFADLVHRHIRLVYSVALRYVGNSPDAQDVTQAVFVVLAQKAAGLRQRTTLTGWLYETTRFTSARLLRTRTRQQAREQEAYMQSTLNEPDTHAVWRQLAPVLEEAMTRLNEKERALLALRFFENKSAAETASLLGIREGAAHKRAARALEKLRRFFLKRGIASTTASIAGAISTHSMEAAPPALAKSIGALAAAKGAAAGASTLTLVNGTLKAMAWAKAKIALAVAAAGALLAAGTATVMVRAQNPQATADHDFQLLQSVYMPYQNASMKPMRNEDKPRFFADAESGFTKALAKTTGGGFLRLRVMDELGVLQRNLGKTNEAAQTYTNMAAYAVKTKDLAAQVTAASGLFEMAWLGEVGDFTRRVSAYESLSRQLYIQSFDYKTDNGPFCDTLNHIATVLIGRAKKPGIEADAKDLLEHAEKLLQESVGLGDAGLTPPTVKLWWLGDCQTRLGERQEAATTYEKILAMNQKQYSRLWIEYLRIGETTEKDSQSYRDAIEEALADNAKSGAIDDYAGNLRHELGLSYLKAGQYTKSAEIFKANIGKTNDKALDAYDTLLESDSFGNAGDMTTRMQLLLDLVKNYPHSGSANAASNDLEVILEQTPNTPLAETATGVLQELKRTAAVIPQPGDPAKN